MGQIINKFKYMSAVGKNAKKANIFIAAYVPDNIDFKRPMDIVLYFHGNQQSPGTIVKNKSLQKKIDAAANAILVGIGKAANPGRTEPKKFDPHAGLLGDVAKGLWHSGGVKEHKTAPAVFSDWSANLHPHVYGFSGGGGALTNYLNNMGAAGSWSFGFKHVQYNDGIYTWLKKTKSAVKFVLSQKADTTTVTLRYGAYAGSSNKTNAKKVVKYIKEQGATVAKERLASVQFKGSHAVAIRLLDTDKFLTTDEVLKNTKPPADQAPAPAPDPEPQPEPKEEEKQEATAPTTSVAIFPKVLRAPYEQKKIVLKQFMGEVLDDFKYFNKFVFFGEEIELKAYAAKVQEGKAGVSTEQLFWFGQFKVPDKATEEQIFEKAKQAARDVVIKEKIVSEDKMKDFKFALDKNMFFKNSKEKNQYRFFAMTTISQVVVFGSPKVTFKDEAQTYAPKPVQNPSSTNFSRKNSAGNYVSQMRYADLKLYTSIAQQVLANLDERVKFYDIKFDAPVDLIYYGGLISAVPTQILDILTANNKHGDNAILWFEFDPKYKQLLNLSIIPEKVLETRHDSDDYERLDIPAGMFKEQRLNSLIWNLPIIYNKYTVNSWGFRLKKGGRGIFTSADQIRVFLNQFFFPSPSIVTSDISRKLLEKFILGDARLLDDKFYKEYIVSREEMPVLFRENMNNQISRQYEAIGDLLGDRFIRGEFRQITSVDDLYDQVLDYISIPDLVRLAAQCLLKLLPLDKLLDAICKPVLKKWDKHKEAIIQALEKQDDGIAKDLAEELKQMYFELVENDYAEQVGGSITQYIQSLPQLIQDQFDEGSWGSSASMGKMIGEFYQNVKMLLQTYGVGETSLQSRLMSINSRIKNLEDELFKLQQKLKVFGGNIPPNKAQSLAHYQKQIADLGETRERLRGGIDNITDQLRLYNLFLPISFYDYYQSQAKKEKFASLVQAIEGDTTPWIFPLMLSLNPYVSTEEKEKILSDSLGGMAGTLTPPAEAINLLNDFKTQFKAMSWLTTIVIDVDPDKFAFNFTPNYEGKKANEKETIFDFNLSAVMMVFQTLRKLNADDPNATGPAAVMASVSNFGASTVDEYFDQVFNDPTKRYHLCLAIYAAVPAVAMLIKQLIEDPSAITAIFDGFIRRLKMFGRMDYPIQDILAELAASLAQIGYNLARDLVITGIMHTIQAITQACSDEDKINTPYSPLGAVDLSAFIMESTVGSNSSPTGQIDQSPAYKSIQELQPDITVSQFKTILAEISNAFTIKEMCSMLDGAGKPHLYSRAQTIFNSIDFLQGSSFLEIYGSNAGIRQFFTLITQDINPNFCAQAIVNFEKEKSMLLEICFGADDATLRDMFCQGKTDEECLDLLSARTTLPEDLMGKLVDELDGLFTTFEIPEPCADGQGIFDDSQSYAAEKIGHAVFGALEKSLESDLSNVKSIYDGTFAVFGNSNLFGKTSQNKMSDIVKQSNKDADDRDPNVMKKLMNSIDNDEATEDTVATKLLSQIQDFMIQNVQPKKFLAVEDDKSYLISNSAFRRSPPMFAALEEGESRELELIHKIIGSPAADQVGNTEENPVIVKTISFKFDEKTSPNTSLIARTSAQTLGDPDVPDDKDVIEDSSLLVRYKTNKFQDLIDLEEGADKLLYTPENILFLNNPAASKSQPTGICTVQPEYNALLRQRINNFALRPQNDFYIHLLNAIYTDLFSTSFKTGLFLRKNFEKLLLNEKIDFQNCHLGFMNMDVLTRHLQMLARKLACFAPESATASPINVAMIKISLDILIRTIAIKELMKSLFVYGLYPEELIKDNEVSVFDIFLSNEIEKAIERRVSKDASLGGTLWKRFYNEVIKEFIVDIVKVINQDELITPEVAYEQLKLPQINFAKNTLRNGFTKISSIYDPMMEGTGSEYQMLQDVLSLPENTDLPASEKYIELENLSMADQCEALQNDLLTLYINNSQFKTRINFTKFEDAEDAFLPLFPEMTRQTRNAQMQYYDHKTLQLTSSDVLPTILQGNDGGPALERMIECKPVQGAFTPVQQAKIILFFSALGDPAIIKGLLDINFAKDIDTVPSRIYLRNFFYETKLIMLVPQLQRIIDSLLYPLDDDNALYAKYIKYKTVEKTKVVEVEDEDGNKTEEEVTYQESVPTGVTLFADMFKYNYCSEEFPDEVFEIIHNKDLQKDLSWELGGKMTLNDLQNLILGSPDQTIGGFRYPYYDTPPNEKAWKGNKETPLKPNDNQSIEKQAIYQKYSVGAHSTKNNVHTNGTSLRRLYGVFENVTGLPIESPITFNAHKKAFEMMISTGWGGKENFFHWLYDAPVNSVLSTFTVMRMTGYVDLPPHSTPQTKLQEFAQELVNPLKQPINPDTTIIIPSLLYEKIGSLKYEHLTAMAENVEVSDPSSKPVPYITLPLFETKKKIPDDVTWYDFFINVDNRSYLNDYFYTDVFKAPAIANWDVNKAVFRRNLLPETVTEVKNTNYILNYLNTYRAVSSFRTEKKDPVYVEKYQNAIWFNIRNQRVTLEAILQHWEDQGAGPIPGSSLNFSKGPEFNHDPFAYLTEASKASLREDSGFFLNEAEDALSNLPGRKFTADGTNTYDDGYSMANNVGGGSQHPHPVMEGESFAAPLVNTQTPFYGTQGKVTKYLGWGDNVTIEIPCIGNSIHCKVGEWDVVNSQGEVIKAGVPKFVAIRNAYKADGHAVRWIDHGWAYWHSDSQPGSDFFNTARTLSRQFPGTWFDPHGWWLVQSGFYPPSNQMTKVSDDGYWNPPWINSHQKDRYKKSGAVLAQWAPGFIIGGLRATTRMKVPLDVQTEAKEFFTAYQLFLGLMDESDREMFKVFIKSFFIKEQTTIIAMLHKLLAEKFYPELETNFDVTIDLALETLFTAVATAKGDYQHKVSDDIPIDLQMVTGMLLKMFFGAMANTVDPTWKTPWFMPGPITPFGVVAKYLDKNGDLFNSDPTKATKPKPKSIPAPCTDAVEEQYNFFMNSPTNSNSSDEEPEDS